MSDEKKEVVDTYWEHELHDKYDEKCSVCYADKIDKRSGLEELAKDEYYDK